MLGLGREVVHPSEPSDGAWQPLDAPAHDQLCRTEGDTPPAGCRQQDTAAAAAALAQTMRRPIDDIRDWRVYGDRCG